MAKKTARKTTRRRKSTKPLSATERKARERAIVSDIRAGALTYRKIAEKHSVSLPTVNLKARKFGLSRRPGRSPKPRHDVAGMSGGAGFAAALQALVLQYRPDTSLAQFERLKDEMLRILGSPGSS